MNDNQAPRIIELMELIAYRLEGIDASLDKIVKDLHGKAVHAAHYDPRQSFGEWQKEH